MAQSIKSKTNNNLNHKCSISKYLFKTKLLKNLPCPCDTLNLMNELFHPLLNSMPVSDLRLTHSSNVGFHLRRSYDEKLRNSKNRIDSLRRQVEYLKYKKNKVGINPDEKFNSWITSGPLGSRDAVLVFRTSILDTKIGPNDSSSQTTLNSSVSSLNGNQDNKDDLSQNSSCSNISSDSSCNEKAKILLTSSKPPMNSNMVVQMNKLANKMQNSTKKQQDLSDNFSIGESSNSSDGCSIWNAINSNNPKSGYGFIKNLAAPKYQHQIEPIEPISRQILNNKENMAIFDPNDFDTPDVSDMPASKLNLTYKMINTETRLLRRILHRHGFIEADEETSYSLLWTGAHLKPDILRSLVPYQRVNHFPRSYELTRKDRLYKNIEKIQHLRGYKHFDIVPQSFILPLEMKDLLSTHNKLRGPWIVKPTASSRGRGIFIVNTPESIPAEESILVSKYISNPLCIDGHKCDIRVYVLVTSFDPLVIYLYEEGLVRLATVKYDSSPENLWNPCMHLCNYSVNKYHSDYIKANDADEEDVGHKWTLSALLRHLKNQGCDTAQLMANIEDLIIKSLFSCAQSIISACRMFVPNGNNCFELYGFDVLVDDTLKPWLLEINLSPSLGIDSPLDTKVKASLMTDLLSLVGIPAYTHVQRAHYDKKWSRFRNINHGIRSNSTESITKRGPAAPLSPEEQRVVRHVKLQDSRRGGFVRIFPTELTLQKYGSYLDPVTGVPISTTLSTGQFSMVVQHNYNIMLFNQLYDKDAKIENSLYSRIQQYERALEKTAAFNFSTKKSVKCVEESTRLRNKIRKLIENGSEMTQLQARQCFSQFLEGVLHRLIQEPKSLHEKLVLKFISRVGNLKTTPTFLTYPFNIISKDRSAMVAKSLSEYLEEYKKETEAYLDTFDNYGMIPINLFNEFLSHAAEWDLESVLTLHTNITHSLPFLYNRFNSMPAPPIPQGPHGFLKALPSMVPAFKENSKIDNYYRYVTDDESRSTTTTSSALTNDGKPKLEKRLNKNLSQSQKNSKASKLKISTPTNTPAAIRIKTKNYSIISK